MAKGKGLTERRKYKRFKIKKELSERRRHKRFKVKDTIFAVLKPHDIRMGQITDINEKGFAFYHIDIRECSNDFLESSKLSLFLNEGIIYLDKVPIKSISKLRIADRFISDFITMKHLFLQFGELTPHQKSRLKYFLRNHTDGFLQDRRSYAS
ncbi:MAG: hypothetical protein KAV87_21090 [Desulfobacteraceae bacterium]|jgi:hypothetical protein|nr:hypothetical protein [Desulfobacteraceae bacterium]